MDNLIRVLYKPVGKPLVAKMIPRTLEAYQGLVGGLIEPFRLGEDILIVLNEEGVIRGLGLNPLGARMFFGDWFICGEFGEEFASVPDWYEMIIREILRSVNGVS